MTLFSNVPSAASVADADYVLGLQGSTGPGTGNTAKMTLQQIVNLVGTGPFSSLSVTGNASIGGALTLSGNPTTALQAATKGYADLMLPLAGGTMTGALAMGANQIGGSNFAVTGGSATGLTNLATTTGSAKFHAITGNPSAYAGAMTQANTPFWGSQFLTGSPTANSNGYISPYSIFVTDGCTLATSTTSLDAVHVKLVPGTAGWTGSRQAIVGQVILNATPGSSSYDNAGIGGQFYAQANVNNGGTGGGPGAGNYLNYHGGIFGANPGVVLSSGATFFREVAGMEVDITVLATGANAPAQKYGMTIVQAASDAARGVDDDAAIALHNQSTAATSWLRGIQFGGFASKWAFGTDSILIGAIENSTGGTYSIVADTGIDFTAVTFTTAFLKSTGFVVDASGNVTAPSIGNGSSSLQISGSGAWTANGAVATSLTGVGPTGAHTTVQEWFTVKNASGTVRYIPAF